jgi:diaminopimelate epimerase
MQAVGNDFVLVDHTVGEEACVGWPRLAVALCDRRFGVGGDGLLVFGPSGVADARMRMFNPDGTEDMCGNGLRCVIHHARTAGRLSASGAIETLAGARDFRVDPNGTITTGMGVPHFAPADLPMNTPGPGVLDFPLPLGDDTFLPISVVSTGTPHTVVFVDELPGDETFLRVSPAVENHPLFPLRTSVLWTVAEPPNTLRLRIWERGAGETLGCGTGACAAAVLARVQGKLAGSGPITVASKGGTLHVDWAGGLDDVLFLTGHAHDVYSGRLSVPVEEG